MNIALDAARHHYLAEFARIGVALPGVRAPWLGAFRKEALDLFAQRGFPTRRDENWRYTSVAEFERHAFCAPVERHADALAEALVARCRIGDDGGHVMVFHNGHHAPALSSPGSLPAGVTLASLADTLDAAPDTLEPYLAGTASPEPFDALNAALMTDGAYLHLGRGAVLDAPVHLLFICTGGGVASHVRNIVVAEDGAQATVIEHYAGIDDATYFTNAVTRIHVSGNASVTHHKLQQEAQNAFHFAGIHALQQRDSRFESHAFSFGAALARNDISTAFAASGCDATLNGLYLADGRQHVDHHTRIGHDKPHGTSREQYRGVLSGQSHAVFNGKVVVGRDAQKTNASQANHNLLLSPDAEIDTKPELQIYADDVKCTHGATIGRLDEAQLFYLRSRGVDAASARSLLVHAFAHDVIGQVGNALLRARLEQLLQVRLPQANLTGGVQ